MEFIAFDLETTGTTPNNDAIVEIGAVRFQGSKPEVGFGKLINPRIPIPDDAYKVNGITNEMVLNAPLIEDVLDEFADFCGDLPLVAHNASFDFKFLLADINRLRSRAPTGFVLDTLSLARKVFPGLANYKLWTLVRHFEFPSGTFHRAEEDSIYCGMLFSKIIETIQLRGGGISMADLSEVVGKKPFQFPQFSSTDQMDLF